MDVTERLRIFLRSCSWVRDPATALRLVPELAVDVPAPVDMITTEGAGERAIPARCVDVLMEPVATVVVQLGEASIEGKPREELHRAGTDRVLADPLVTTVAELLSQSAGPGLSAQGIPALCVAWLSSRMLGGSSPDLKERRPELFARVAKLTTRVSELPSTRRGEVLADITWGLRGRLAAAVSVAQAGGWSVDAGGLYRRIMADSLVLAFPRGALDDAIPFGILARLLGLPLEESLAASIEKAAGAVIPALVDRRTRGKATPTDDALASAFSADLAAAPTARGVLFDLWSGPLLIASLPDLADARLLGKANVPKEVANALMRRDVVRALAASWRDLVNAMLAWDVMSSVVARVTPIRQVKGAWSVGAGRLVPHPRWDLLVPRPILPPTQATVVAVGLGAARGRVAAVAADRKRPLLAGAADGVWARLVAEDAAGVYAVVGEKGLGAFLDPLAALAFARKARRAFGGPVQVPVGYLGEPIELPPGVSAPVGMATGEIRGGTDGTSVWLDGPAVAEAISLVGRGEPDLSADEDPAGIRGAAVGPDGLRNRGIVAAPSALASLMHATRDLGRGVHARGKGGAVGDVGEPFSFYSIDTWLEPEEGTIVAALALGPAEGPCELTLHARSAFRTLHETDSELARARKGRAAAPPAASAFSAFNMGQAPTAPAADPFGSGGAARDPFAAADPFAGAQPSPAESPPWGGSSGTAGWGPPPPPAAPPPPAPRPTPAARPAAPPPRPAAPPAPAAPAAPAAPPRAAAPRPAAAPPPRAPEPPAKAPSAADIFAGASGWAATEAPGSLDDLDLPDPFADFDTEPGKVPGGAPAVSRLTPRGPLPPDVDPESAPTLAPELPEPADHSGLEFFDPLPDAGDLFGDSYEGPSVSIEEDGWGGESELDGAPEPAQGFGFAMIPDAPDAPETPASIPSGPTPAWPGGFQDGFDMPAPESGADAEAEDVFGPGGGGAGPIVRTENILELDAGSGAEAFGFSRGAAQHDYGSAELADRINAAAGGSSFEAEGGGMGFAFVEEEEGAAAPSLAPDAPLTWGDALVPPAEQHADDQEIGALFAGSDSGEPTGVPFDQFPESDSENIAFEGEAGEDDALSDFPFADFPSAGTEIDGLPDFETGSFNIEEPEDHDALGPLSSRRPSSPTPPPRTRTPPPRAPVPPVASAPPPRPAERAAPATPDFGYLFMGYVVYLERGEAIFGRPYGRLLVDAHAYRPVDDIPRAYRSFLADKVREGFVPQTDRTRPYPDDHPGEKLDGALLEAAYRAMF